MFDVYNPSLIRTGVSSDVKNSPRRPGSFPRITWEVPTNRRTPSPFRPHPLWHVSSACYGFGCILFGTRQSLTGFEGKFNRTLRYLFYTNMFKWVRVRSSCVREGFPSGWTYQCVFTVTVQSPERTLVFPLVTVSAFGVWDTNDDNKRWKEGKETRKERLHRLVIKITRLHLHRSGKFDESFLRIKRPWTRVVVRL